MYPGELAKIVRGEIVRYHDRTLQGRLFDEQSRLLNDLESIQDTVYGAHDDSIESLRSEYEQIAAEFSERLQTFNRKANLLWQAIRNDMEERTPDIEDYAIPAPAIASEKENALYDSGRGYLAQMACYKDFQGKEQAQIDLAAD